MAVPNTNTFSLQDVENEIPGTQGNLISLFAASIDSGFDATYKGSKNALYNFRNYSHVLLGSKNGFLYNYYTFLNANFAPTGWHVPTLAEWSTLLANVGGASIAGPPLSEVGTAYWGISYGTNTSGFTGRGSGRRNGNVDGAFRDILTHAWFGASNYYDAAWSTASNAVASQFINLIYRDGYSARFIKDNSTNPGTVSDYDGNVYECVTIGGQVWTKQNWKSTKLNNGGDIPLVTLAATWLGLTSLARCAYNNDLNNV